MKTFKIFFLYITIMLASCSDDIASGSYFASTNEYSLNFSSSGLQDVPAEGGVITAKIDATSAVNWELQGLPSWLMTTTMRGTGSQDISFNVAANESFTSPRTQIFNIVTRNSDWSITIPVTITQQNKTKILSVAPSDDNSLTFDAKGGQLVLSLESNISWVAECSDDFVHLSQTSGYTDSKIGLTVDVYNYIDVTVNRTASVYFKDSKESETLQVIKITQKSSQNAIEPEDIFIEFDQNKNSKDYLLGSIAGGYYVSSDDTWLKIIKNKGTDNVDVTIQVEPNENDDERSSKAYVYLEGNNVLLYTFLVKQNGNQIEVSPSSLSFSANGGTNSVEVKTNGRWMATCKDDWLSVKQEGETCKVSVKENNSLSARSSSIQINRLSEDGEPIGKSVALEVNQESRHISINSNVLQFDPESATKPLTIDCDVKWTLTTKEQWITLSSTSGSGNATISVTVEENTSFASRTGKLYLNSLDNTIEIEVAQSSAFVTVESNSVTITANGGSLNFSLLANVSWSASSSESWLVVSPQNGKKDNTLTLTASKNYTSEDRVALLTISSIAGDIKVNVKQNAPSIELSTTSLSFLEEGGTSEAIIVSAEYEYKITTSDPWITVNENENTFTVKVDENKLESRTGWVIVSLLGLSGTIEKSIEISQKGDDIPYVDLGLPSGTKWALYQRGATKLGDEGISVSGLESDKYNCPTYEQVEELIKMCNFKPMTLENTLVYEVIGPNGNYIVFNNGRESFWINGNPDPTLTPNAQYYYSNRYGSSIAHENDRTINWAKHNIREVRVK